VFRMLTVLMIFAAAGCMSSDPPPPTVDITTPNHDVEALAQIITLDPLPQQVSWVYYGMGMPSSAPGPTDYALTAVLEYDSLPDSLQGLKRQTGDVTVNTEFIQDWFPTAVREAFVAEGDRLRLTVPHYEPKSFSPLAGYMFIVDNTVFLYVFTM
jgi:hypothetical protein